MSEITINILAAITGALATAFIGAAAYFVKRHIEKADKAEIDNFLDGYERLRNIGESNNPPTATTAEIQDIHKLITDIQNNINGNSEDDINHYEGAWTQADLNRIGGAEFAEADAKLNLTYEKLMSYQDGACAEAFDGAVKKWKEFRHEYAVFIAETYAGGSIQPLMYSGTAVEITNQFNQLLKIELDERMNR